MPHPRSMSSRSPTSPSNWAALGFEVGGRRCQIGAVRLRFTGTQPGAGIVALVAARRCRARSSTGCRPAISTAPAAGACAGASQRRARDRPRRRGLAGSAIAASQTLQAAGLDLRRVREEPTPAGRAAPGVLPPRARDPRAGPGARAASIERAGGPERPARFWGLALLVEDLDARRASCSRRTSARCAPAVQPGRRIATVRRSAGLAVPLALMSRDERRRAGAVDERGTLLGRRRRLHRATARSARMPRSRPRCAASADGGLPPIALSPAQGKLLHLLARIHGARSILELGTLGGYSTIWLARALPADGRLITLELNPDYAEVAAANVERAGLAGLVKIKVGPALDSLRELIAEGAGPFDLIFIDADKQGTPEYFEHALELSRPGSVIVTDNVVRGGELVERRHRGCAAPRACAASTSCSGRRAARRAPRRSRPSAARATTASRWRSSSDRLAVSGGELKLGLNTGYWAGGPPPGAVEAVAEAERLGFDSIWTAEAYGSDCLTPLAWWGASTERIKLGTAIVQMSARQPAADGDGGDDDGPSVRRPVHPRARRLRAAGRRGLVRDAVRQAARAHARVHRDPARHVGAQGPLRSARDRTTRCRCRAAPASASR